MAKPIIGISADITHGRFDQHFVYEQYLNAVEQAGGIPVILPTLMRPERAYRQLEAVDGYLGIGSDDYDPAIYGEVRHPHTRLMFKRREQHDLITLNLVWQMRLPAFMICGSMQGMNLVLGGDLHQHLNSEVEHRSGDGLEPVHSVAIVKSSRLASLTGRHKLEVNSIHHQAVRNVPESLVVVARADDGVIEALEPADQEHPLFAVQWHPERMNQTDESKAMFEWLIDEAIRTKPIPINRNEIFRLSPFV